VLPHAIANGRNQNGTIAGKLNGTIAAQTPTGWRIVSASMLRRDVLEHAALHRRSDRARALDHLDHARDLGARVDRRLAHLERDRARQILLTQPTRPLAQLEQLARAGDRRRRPPFGRARAALHRRVEVRDDESGTRASVSPVAGLVTSSSSVAAVAGSTGRRCSCRARA
jgi:hypothetical protein